VATDGQGVIVTSPWIRSSGHHPPTPPASLLNVSYRLMSHPVSPNRNLKPADNGWPKWAIPQGFGDPVTMNDGPIDNEVSLGHAISSGITARSSHLGPPALVDPAA
jgi:hypothetical protein